MIETGGAVHNIVTGGSMGLGLGGAFLMVRWIANFIAGRIDRADDRLEKRKDGLLDRLEVQINRLTERVANLEDELEECRRMHAEERQARLEMAAMIQGAGSARQHASLIIAAEKASAKKAAD